MILSEEGCDEIDKALGAWRQGDCVLGEHWFLFRLEVGAPLTAAASAASDEGINAGETEVLGFMVATQTCDVVRRCHDRPFVEVCPLVEAGEELLNDIRFERRPGYALVPGVANQGLVADLDRVMTVEKAVVARWPRTAGWSKDEECRSLSRALARKRQRFAFPDDFVALMNELNRRISDKHGKHSDEGRALRALREIRVHAAPQWDATNVALTFWFIRNADEPRFEQRSWADFPETWLELIPAGGRFTSIDGAVQTLDDLTARDYVESDPLDLDRLSPLVGNETSTA